MHIIFFFHVKIMSYSRTVYLTFFVCFTYSEQKKNINTKGIIIHDDIHNERIIMHVIKCVVKVPV